jgi:predicted MFS family arabinose efflux permease
MTWSLLIVMLLCYLSNPSYKLTIVHISLYSIAGPAAGNRVGGCVSLGIILAINTVEGVRSGRRMSLVFSGRSVSTIEAVARC